MPIAAVATGPEDDGGSPVDLTASFAEEIQKRQATQAAATEMESATDFDGAALLEVLLDRFSRAMAQCICVFGIAASVAETLCRALIAMCFICGLPRRPSNMFSYDVSVRCWSVGGHFVCIGMTGVTTSHSSSGSTWVENSLP